MHLGTVDTSELSPKFKKMKWMRTIDVGKICESAVSQELYKKPSTELLLDIRDWLLKCACHPSVDKSRELMRAMRNFTVPQPCVNLRMESN
jgi:hypothetical protein